MVYIAQLAERWFVEPEAMGSSPIIHTICTFSSIGRASEYESGGWGFESFKVYKR